MLALAAALFLQNSALPEKAAVSYSGIPTVSGGNITVQSHTVTILLSKDHADVSSLTMIKNNGPAGKASIEIGFGSLRQASLPTGVSATWANTSVALVSAKRMDQLSGTPPMHGSGAMQSLGTYALRMKYSVPLGKCGFDHKQFIAAYDLTSPVPIGTLMVTYSYAPGVVFHEPEAGPGTGWQIGLKGAFLRVDNYDGKAGLSYCAFYSGGFKPIGQ
jgi:hypothetical protein